LTIGLISIGILDPDRTTDRVCDDWPEVGRRRIEARENGRGSESFPRAAAAALRRVA